MNIIPFLFVLLLAFQMLFFSLQREVMHTNEEVIFSRSAHFLERSLRSKEAYRALPKKKIKAKKNANPQTIIREFDALRITDKKKINSQLNITPFFQETNALEQKALNDLFNKMLLRLYGSLFSSYGTPKNVSEKLLKEFKSKKLQKEDNLTILYPNEAKLAELYYILLKGTHDIQLSKRSIPPFPSHFRLSADKTSKPICFPMASVCLLEEMFGEKIARAILAQEKKKSMEKQTPSALNLSELESLLNQERFPLDQARPLLAMMDFSIPENTSVPEESIDKRINLTKKGAFSKQSSPKS